MFAYGNRYAVTRVQLRLADAAHILPVKATGSYDAVQNGIALSPTYHRAFDAGLLYLNEHMEMRIDEGKVRLLQQPNLAGGGRALPTAVGANLHAPRPQPTPLH
jgi:putative restriction endonuclease